MKLTPRDVQLKAPLLGLLLLLPLGCGHADDSALLQSSSDALLCGASPCNRSQAPTATRSSAAGAASTPGTSPDAGACYSDDDCAGGWECEHEHGQSYCKPHGGDHASAGDAGTDAGPDCEGDQDCDQGERCQSLGHSRHACVPEHQEDEHEHQDGAYEDRSGSSSGHH